MDVSFKIATDGSLALYFFFQKVKANLTQYIKAKMLLNYGILHISKFVADYFRFHGLYGFNVSSLFARSNALCKNSLANKSL
jgi:hypothetical protein